MKKSIDTLLKKAEKLYREGRYSATQKICNQILLGDSQNVSALTILGNISFLLREYEQSLAYYKKIEQISPNYLINLINLANVYFEQNNFADSQKYAFRALQQDSKNITALSLLGNSLMAQDEFDSALEIFYRLLQESPNDCWTLNSLSQIWQKKGDSNKAFDYAFAAVENSCGDEAQQLNLGYFLYETILEKGYDSVSSKISLWEQKYGELPQVSYMINALKNNQKVDIAEPSYLQNVFDNFASGFEQVLSGLDYSVPKYISEYLQEFYTGFMWKKLHILDAGCGTGLCGAFLKKYASWRGLDGVDISEGMLREAKKKNIYNNLYQQELNSFLFRCNKSYNLIVAADVLTYFGNLEKVIKYSSQALKKNGRFIFSITQNISSDSDWFLHSSGRFTHNISYVQKLLTKYDFVVEKLEQKKLRLENDIPVIGYIISAQKNS